MRYLFFTYLTILIPVFLLGNPTFKQDRQEEITFEVNVSKEKLGVNERLRVEFTMNKDGDNFTPPNFNGFKVVMGPSQSISSSWAYGKRSFSKSYGYILTPINTGNFEIGQATIEIDGKTYKTIAKRIRITNAVANPNAPKSANDIADENLYLVAEVSKGSPYLNEAVTVLYKLYISPSVSVTNFKPLDSPKYNNFWSQDIPVKRYDTKNDTYDGKPFRSVILKRVVLYPQKEGRLTIEPLALEIYVDVPTNRRDFFGGKIFKQATKRVSAGRRTLNVKPLPEAGKPADFSGAVGDFDFAITTSKTDLNASESLQARVEVSGKGNLKLFKLPEPELPSSLEVYEPEYDEDVLTVVSGMQGKVANNYTVVPSFRGKYPIPSISFSYFNPKTKQYNTLKSDEISINVKEGPEDTNASISANAANQKLVVKTGKQFHFIKVKPKLKTIGSNYFFGSTNFYLLLLAPPLLIPLCIVLYRRRKEQEQDVVGNKVKKASRLARKYLSTAKKELGNEANFYIALEKALHNYLKAKLKIETSEFSKEKISSLLTTKKVDLTTTESFISLLENCEQARYSPFTEVQMQQDYDKASEVISKIDKQL